MTTFAEPINETMEHTPDVFYETDHLSLQEKREILILAHQLCFDWRWDVLVGFSRETVGGKLFEDCLEGFGADDHFVFIHRKGFSHDLNTTGEWCIETGYTSLSTHGYLFIYVDQDALNIFTDTFNLEPMKL